LIKAFAVEAENRIASLALGGIMLLPLAEIATRKFLGTTIPGSGAIASALTLWLGMLGAAIAAREGKLLTLATGEFLPAGRISAIAHVFSGMIGAMVATIFTMGGIALVRSDRMAGDVITAGIPTWIADLALPLGFGLIAMRLVWRASPVWKGRAIAALGVAAGLLLNQYRGGLENQSLLPWFAIIITAGVLGAPIFALLGGFALFASLVRGNPPVVLPMMAYQELTTSTGIAAIPLFTLAGFLLAEGRSSERLLRVFRAWVG
jgi:C4-dicarboxylate transporter, DctM subunit